MTIDQCNEMACFTLLSTCALCCECYEGNRAALDQCPLANMVA